jgi:hypothetical protein
MAYDATTQTIVLFGGYGAPCNAFGDRCTLLNDTWIWDGTNWSQPALAMSPPARYFASITDDAATRSVVLFGGASRPCDPSGDRCTPLNDTWTWDGITWQQRLPVSSPSGRFSSNMADDVARGTVVLFGGCCAASGGGLDETWTWNQTTWTQQTPATHPPAGYLASMAYDGANQSVVLFGGCCDSTGSFSSSTWMWDGTTWTQPITPTAPPARAYASMAYDGATSSIVLFAGCCGSFSGDTWSLQ